MWWVVWWTFVTAAGLAGTVAAANGIRFSRRVAKEARVLVASSQEPPSIAPSRLSDLPAPVQRYTAKAIGGRAHAVRWARLRHGGVFRPSLGGSWLPIRGEQYFSANPPGFIWWGRVRIAPGLWIDARDRSVDGAGNMLVTAESTVTLANATGPQLDQGALLRLLGELVWLPTALLDERYIRWSAVDEGRAAATLQVNGRTVSGEFAFGSDDLPTTFSAERYRDAGGGRSVLTPFVGRLSGYRPIDGLLVPHRVVGAWVIDGRAVEYANFEVQQIDYYGGAASRESGPGRVGSSPSAIGS